MNRQLTVDKKYWLKRNPNIKFCRVKKAFYGTYLLKVKLQIWGASMRYYYNGSPLLTHMKNLSYERFLKYLKSHVVRFNMQKLIKVVDNRFIYVTVGPGIDKYGNKANINFNIYDARALYVLHNLLEKKPKGIRFTREQNVLQIYSNNINDTKEVINQLKIPSGNIISITSPDDQDISALLSGKEFSTKADRFKYKVFLKSSINGEGMPALSNYLKSIGDTDEVEVPRHCTIAIKGSSKKWAWEYSQRSYLYVKNEDTILLIKLLAGNRYSTCLELILPKKELDK